LTVVGHDDGVEGENECWVGDRGYVVLYGERVDVEDFLGACLQDVVECAEAFFIEIFGLCGRCDFEWEV
jgi:hypothetical protein